jgi:hypothetical protein
MRLYGDSFLRTITFEVLSELFGNENDSAVMKVIPWAVSNVFYEQILLHYGLGYLRVQLPLVESKGLTVKRGDTLEAYMAGIAMDVSRVGEGYGEIRDWMYKIMRLRLRNLGSGRSQVSPLTPENSSIAVDPYSLRSRQPDVLFKLRQSIFDNMKEAVRQVQWTTTIPTVAQLLDFWSRVKIYLDDLCAMVVPWEEAQILLVHYYRVHTDCFVFSPFSRM